MDYDQLIRNWHAKASDDDYFSKFIFEYLAFIAFLKRKKFIEASQDRRAIQLLKQSETTKDAYLKRIEGNGELQESWEQIIAELGRSRLGDVSGNGEEVEEIKWWNNSHSTLEEQTPEERARIKGVINNLEDWGNMVEFWYSIRNNLFHGGKNPQDDRDRLLVECGYKTLHQLVEVLLASNQ